jgi:hypothetical protein
MACPRGPSRADLTVGPTSRASSGFRHTPTSAHRNCATRLPWRSSRAGSTSRKSGRSLPWRDGNCEYRDEEFLEAVDEVPAPGRVGARAVMRSPGWTAADVCLSRRRAMSRSVMGNGCGDEGFRCISHPASRDDPGTPCPTLKAKGRSGAKIRPRKICKRPATGVLSGLCTQQQMEAN